MDGLVAAILLIVFAVGSWGVPSISALNVLLGGLGLIAVATLALSLDIARGGESKSTRETVKDSGLKTSHRRVKNPAGEAGEDRGLVLRVDPMILPAAVVVLFLTLAGEPWWTMTGSATSSLLTMQVSPYYFQANAIGLARSAPFADLLGPFTRLLLIIGLIGLAASSVRPTAWWRDLVVYFGLCSLTVLYLSFFLMYQGVQAALLGAYGVIPPYLLSGAGSLPAMVIGLDLNTYLNPSVTGGFSFPFYLGFLGIGLLGGRLIISALQARKKRTRRKGVAAIFSSENGGLDRDLENNSTLD